VAFHLRWCAVFFFVPIRRVPTKVFTRKAPWLYITSLTAQTAESIFYTLPWRLSSVLLYFCFSGATSLFNVLSTSRKSSAYEMNVGLARFSAVVDSAELDRWMASPPGRWCLHSIFGGRFGETGRRMSRCSPDLPAGDA